MSWPTSITSWMFPMPAPIATPYQTQSINSPTIIYSPIYSPLDVNHATYRSFSLFVRLGAPSRVLQRFISCVNAASTEPSASTPHCTKIPTNSKTPTCRQRKGDKVWLLRAEVLQIHPVFGAECPVPFTSWHGRTNGALESRVCQGIYRLKCTVTLAY